MAWHQLIGFALAVTPIMLTPGVSATLVVQRVAKEGRGAGFRVAAGTACGLAIHGLTAVLGLAALIAQSAAAFSVLKAVGAAYLVLLGIRLIWSASRGHDDRPAPKSLPWTLEGAFAQSLVANVLNPRAASVYLTLVPQFVAPDANVLAMTVALVAVHIALQTAWLSLWTMIVSTARRSLSSAPVRRSLEALSGAVFVGLGVRTAVQNASH
jgi:threonine/homoserine/homoserine lactone efflux protein